MKDGVTGVCYIRRPRLGHTEIVSLGAFGWVLLLRAGLGATGLLVRHQPCTIYRSRVRLVYRVWSRPVLSSIGPPTILSSRALGGKLVSKPSKHHVALGAGK